MFFIFKFYFKKMTKYCDCRNDYHIINHELERKTDFYTNAYIYLWNKTDKSELKDKHTILSVDNYVYSFFNNDVLTIFEKKYHQISLFLQGDKNMDPEISLQNSVSKLINNAPEVDYEFIVYRGLDKNLNVKINDTIEHKNYLLTSLNKKYSMMFVNDTSQCYKNDGRMPIVYKNDGTLLIISVPKYKKFIDLQRSIDFNPCHSHSEILFDKNSELIVRDITVTKKCKIITCDLK